METKSFNENQIKLFTAEQIKEIQEIAYDQAVKLSSEMMSTAGFPLEDGYNYRGELIPKQKK